MTQNILVERQDGHIVNACLTPAKQKNATSGKLLVIMVPDFQNDQNNLNALYTPLSNDLAAIGTNTLTFTFTHSDAIETKHNLTLDSATKDIETLIAWSMESGYTHFAFIAAGLGAPIAYINKPKNTIFYILFWPAFDLKQIQENNKYLEPDCLAELATLDLIPSLEETKSPTLIFHGMMDNVIPPSHLDIARKHLGASRLDITTFQDGEHGLKKDAHRQSCRHHTKAFAEKYAKLTL